MATLTVLQNMIVESNLTQQCYNKPDGLATDRAVVFLKIPGHYRIRINEKADDFARLEQGQRLMGP